MLRYHDEEWGVPVHDDRKLYEYLVLDAFQAGLSWRTVLHKRENFRKAFSGFDPAKVARYGKRELTRLLKDEGIIRNRQKVEASVTNARAFLDVQDKVGTFDEYIWRFVGGRPIIHKRKTIYDLPSTSRESDAMAKDMKSRGFKFCGSTICYAFMQAAGLINDHLVTCFRHKEV
jgi:DNA-3-methyladenine glycosylase I